MHSNLICVVLLFTVAAVNTKNIPKLNEITVVNDIENFVAHNPEVKLIPLIREESKARSQSVRYSIGARVSGDSLVAHLSDTFSYPAPNDVELRLSYPKNGGSDAIVTYLEIIAAQSNNLGNAYIAGGGIGQRNILVIVECKATEYLTYTAQVFGVK